MKYIILLFLPILLFSQNEPDLENESKFGISFIYVPYSKIVVSQFNNDLNFMELNSTIFQQVFETEFSFPLSDNQMFIYGNGSFLRDFGKGTEEYHNVNKNYPSDSYSYGEEFEITTSVLSLEAGLKYYLREIKVETSNIFIQAGIGKSFGSYEREYKDLYPDPDPFPSEYTYSENYDEYYSDLFSPFFISTAIGAEYFFNSYLSLTGVIKIKYSTASGTLKRSSDSPYSKSTDVDEIDYSDIKTRVGLGVVFYY